MNTYAKFVPNVFLAKCTERHEKGETILVTTQYGKENECIVFNLINEKESFFYYSIVRADGFSTQEWAKRKAEKLQNAAINADNKSDAYFQTSHKITENIPMGQPILVGHHSEQRHRRDLDKSWNAMSKCVELSKKSDAYESRAKYWSKKASIINLSMPESIEFYEFELEKAKANHEGLKNGSIERRHSFSLTYAKKEVNELQKKVDLAKRLWL
jgi:hypothetical protein